MVAELSVTGEATLARGFLVSAASSLRPMFPHASTSSDPVQGALRDAERAQRELLDGIGTVLGAGNEQLGAFLTSLTELDATLAAGVTG